MIVLEYDDREKRGNIKKLIETEFANPCIFKGSGDVSCKKVRHTDGDYMIYYKGIQMAIIERKSYSDFASSMSDGRLEAQCAKMKTYLEHCSVFYLVEGELNSRHKMFGNIDYNRIESRIFGLQILDGLNVMRTKNTQDTVKKLKLLCEYFSRRILGGEIIPDGFTREEVIGACVESEEDMKKRLNLSLWCGFKGIGNKTAQKLVADNFTLKNLLDNEIPEQYKGKFKEYDLNTILPKLKGIGPKSAKLFSDFDTNDLNDVLSGRENSITLVKNKTKTVFGKKTIENLKLFYT